MNIENQSFVMVKKKSKLGGKRPGAGRPKGELSERSRTLLEVKDRIAKNVDSLINAQLSEAKGTHLIYRLNPIAKQYVLVTDKDEIKTVLDTYKGAGEEDDGLYIITTKKPDVKAGQYLLDRAYGKPPQSVEIIDETAQKWRSAVEKLISKGVVKSASEAIDLLKSVDFTPPNPQIEQQLISELVQ